MSGPSSPAMSNGTAETPNARMSTSPRLLAQKHEITVVNYVVVLCFDGTTNQFDGDVSSVASTWRKADAYCATHRTQMLSSYSPCCERIARQSSYAIIRLVLERTRIPESSRQPPCGALR